MRMDPFQATQHGSGIWGDIASKLKGFVKKAQPSRRCESYYKRN